MFKTRLAPVFVFALFVSHQALADLAGTYPLKGGPITVTPTAGAVNTGGLEFNSATNRLSNGDDPAPFSFFITGNNKTEVGKVTLGSLGPATIDGPITLDVTVAAGNHEIFGTFGGGPNIPPFVVEPVVPEPDSSQLAVIAILSIAVIRRRRRQRVR